MADENSLPAINSPENSAAIPTTQPANISPAQNDLVTGTKNPSENSLSQKIGDLAGNLAEKFNLPFKRGRGRPRKDGLPNKSAIFPGNEPEKIISAAPGEIPPKIPGIIYEPSPENVLPAQTNILPAPDFAIGALFRRVVCSSVKSAIGVCDAITRLFGKQAGCRTDFVEKCIAANKPEEKAIEEFTECLDLVLKKHNVQPKNAEEIALGIAAVNLFKGYPLMWFEFRAEMQRNASAQNDLMKKYIDLENRFKEMELKKAA